MGDRILVVDDDRELAELLGMLLSKHGYETDVVFNGEEALRAVTDFQPSVILQDYVLPDMKGDELLVMLKEACPDCYIITMTAKGSEEVAAELFRAGASDYLKKPVESDKLIATVENVLRLRSSESTCGELSGVIIRHSREFLLINALSAALNADIPRNDKYDIAADIVMKGMQADYVNISVLTGKEGGPERLTSVCSDRIKGSLPALDAEVGLLKYVAGIKKPATVADFANEERFGVSGVFRDSGITSALAVPMTLSGATVGVLGAFSLKPTNFPSFVIKLLDSFANFIALDIENESLTRRASLLENTIESAIGAVGEHVTVQDTSHRILYANQAAADSAGQPVKDLIGQQCCWIFHNIKEPIKDCPAEEAVSTGKTVEKTLDAGDGKGMITISAHPVLDDEGVVKMVIERVRPA